MILNVYTIRLFVVSLDHLNTRNKSILHLRIYCIISQLNLVQCFCCISILPYTSD